MKILNLFIFLFAFTFGNAQSSRTFLTCENNNLRILRDGTNTFLTCYTYKTSGILLLIESEGVTYKIRPTQGQQTLASMLAVVKECGCYGRSNAQITDELSTIHDNSVKERLKLLTGRQIKYANYTAGIFQGQGVNDGTLFLTSFYINQKDTISGLRYIQTTQGVYNADNNNKMGLYKYNIADTTLTLIASTANDPTLFSNTSNTYREVLFTSQVVVEKGLYYVGYLYNNSAQTTAPTIAGSTSGAGTGAGVNFLSSMSGIRLMFNITELADLPTIINPSFTKNSQNTHVVFELY